MPEHQLPPDGAEFHQLGFGQEAVQPAQPAAAESEAAPWVPDPAGPAMARAAFESVGRADMPQPAEPVEETADARQRGNAHLAAEDAQTLRRQVAKSWGDDARRRLQKGNPAEEASAEEGEAQSHRQLGA